MIIPTVLVNFLGDMELLSYHHSRFLHHCRLPHCQCYLQIINKHILLCWSTNSFEIKQKNVLYKMDAGEKERRRQEQIFPFDP